MILFSCHVRTLLNVNYSKGGRLQFSKKEVRYLCTWRFWIVWVGWSRLHIAAHVWCVLENVKRHLKAYCFANRLNNNSLSIKCRISAGKSSYSLLIIILHDLCRERIRIRACVKYRFIFSAYDAYFQLKIDRTFVCIGSRKLPWAVLQNISRRTAVLWKGRLSYILARLRRGSNNTGSISTAQIGYSITSFVFR